MIIAHSIVVEPVTLVENFNLFFEKKDGIYTHGALLYQDILAYCLDSQKSADGFRFSELATWLMTKNHEFHQYYEGSSVNMSNRIAMRRQRITQCLELMSRLFLIRVKDRVPAKKNRVLTELYEFSDSGHFLALLCKIDGLWATKSKEQQRLLAATLSELYTLVMDKILTLHRDMPSTKVFLRSFIACTYEKGLFGELVKIYLEVLHSEKNYNKTDLVISLLTHIMLYRREKEVYGKHLSFKIGGYSFWQMWIEVFHSLDEQSKKYLLLTYKAILERREELEFSREFEELRYEHIADPMKLVQYTLCDSSEHKLRSETHVVVFDTLKWLEHYFSNKPRIREVCPITGKESEMMIQIHNL